MALRESITSLNTLIETYACVYIIDFVMPK